MKQGAQTRSLSFSCTGPEVKMGTEIRYRCKDSGKYDDCACTIIIAEDVYRLMAERGESLPERCPSCSKKHRAEKRETRQHYFQQAVSLSADRIPKVRFVGSAFTAHGERQRTEDLVEPDASGMQIRITDEHIRELYQELYGNQVVILASPTGTGKSVYVLYRLLEAPPDYEGDFVKSLIRQGQIIQTQPFSFAAASIPETVSKKEIGASVIGPTGILGVRHRNREDYGRHNIAVGVTDGSLRNWLRDGQLGRYSLIMIDEAHKRSVNIDNLLTLLQYQLPFFPHLKVIIASATLNLDEFRHAFERVGISTGVLDLSKTLEEKINYTVHYWRGDAVDGCDCWLCNDDATRGKFWSDKERPPEEAELPSLVSSFVIGILSNTASGGILAFLTGQAVIERTSEILSDRLKRVPALKNVPVIPVYSALGEEEVERRFKDKVGERRVLLVTDIAETSHTLPDIVYEIESGYIKQYQWDPKDMTSTLPTIRHSQAGCRQRFGRVGRTQKGYVYCLYSKHEFEGEFKIQTTPEIFRCPIDETLLTAQAAGISELPSFIGRPDDAERFTAEIRRASSAIKNEGYIDEVGNITDDGLDIFRTPLSTQKKALLDLADEQNCLVEMATFLSMSETADGQPTVGAELYSPRSGLMIWDPRWTASTKMAVWRIHEALKTSCADDLDFVLKLADCYLGIAGGADEGTANKLIELWAEQNFLNQDTLAKAFEARGEMIELFLQRAEDRKPRDLDFTMIGKIRLILGTVLESRLVLVEQRDGRLVYRFPGEQDHCGLISDSCVGAWQDGERALLIAATKKKDSFGGQLQLMSTACSLVRPEPKCACVSDEAHLDQRILIGSKVSIVDRGAESFVGSVLDGPAQINVDYGEKLDFAMLMDDYLRKGYRPSVSFSRDDAIRRFGEIQAEVPVVWKDDRRAAEARVLGWRMDGAVRCALVAPFDERAFLQSTSDEKEAPVRIQKVFGGPQDRRGWVLARTSEGIELPIETGDLSLAHLECGLKCLEGRCMKIPIKKVTVSGAVMLSNIGPIIGGLDRLREDVAQQGQTDLTATIDRVDLTRNTITAFAVDDDGLIYTFHIHVRLAKDRFKGGDTVPIKLTLREGRGYIHCELEDYQIESMPMSTGWHYDPQNERMSYPYFLNQESLADFDVDDGLKDKLIKNSWMYGFTARLDHQ